MGERVYRRKNKDIRGKCVKSKKPETGVSRLANAVFLKYERSQK